MKGSFNTAGRCQLRQNRLGFCAAERTPPRKHTHTHWWWWRLPSAPPHPKSVLAGARVLKDAAGHTTEGLTGVCWPQRRCAIDGGAEKWEWGGRHEAQRWGAAWDLPMGCQRGIVLGRELLPAPRDTPAPRWMWPRSGSWEHPQSLGRGTAAGRGDAGMEEVVLLPPALCLHHRGCKLFVTCVAHRSPWPVKCC